jgi:hypothetical protein
MYELVPPDSHADVRRVGGVDREEDQIAAFDSREAHLASVPHLLPDLARQRDPVLCEYVLDEPAAVEAACIAAAAPIGNPAQL